MSVMRNVTVPVGSMKPPVAQRPSTSPTSSTNNGRGASVALLLMTACAGRGSGEHRPVADLPRGTWRMAEVSRPRPRGTVLRMGTALAIIIVIAVVVVITALVLRVPAAQGSANGGAAPRSEPKRATWPGSATSKRTRAPPKPRSAPRQAGGPRRRAAEARGGRPSLYGARPGVAGRRHRPRRREPVVRRTGVLDAVLDSGRHAGSARG